MILRTKEIKPFIVFLKPPPFEKIIRRQNGNIGDPDKAAVMEDNKAEDFTVS